MSSNLHDILTRLKAGELSIRQALGLVEGFERTSDGSALLDTERRQRTGLPEVIYGKDKPYDNLRCIVEHLLETKRELLVTRLNNDIAEKLAQEFSLQHEPLCGAVSKLDVDKELLGLVLLLSGGTSDMHVVKEVELACRFFGVRIEVHTDVGVSGLHRFFSVEPKLKEADALIVAAGMEGALPSVVAGRVAVPVIGLPVSTGYGAALEGVTAMLAMLSSCAPGVSVVNVDNGVGAAAAAARIAFGKRS
ncbi:MAG: nickel pincer cofactor biosynthesis protein LarB [Planctomycetota bacterium]|nr:nickel pincer cofactor biosynthesis protein LarB [Planctomycetota bacterium]